LVFIAVLDGAGAASHPMREARAGSTTMVVIPRMDLSPYDIDFFISPTKAATMGPDAT
jgi:hypothetical protein